jgi:ABC-2 type transport system permease protein
MAGTEHGSVDQAVSVARVIAWTPFAAPYVLPFDVAEGRWLAAAVRLAMTVATNGELAWWWSRTIESAMLGAASSGQARPVRRQRGGAVASLFPAVVRGLARPTAFGAIVARESRYWWRDARRRASLISILMASAVLPIALNVASSGGPSAAPAGMRTFGAAAFGFAVTMAGTMGGMLLANQFGFDGSAFAAHLLTRVPGRTELRARALAMALVALPVQLTVVVVVGVIAGRLDQLPAGVGLLLTAFGSAIAAAGMLSVLAPYALPENSNPFAMNSGGGSAKGLLAFVAMIGTLLLCVPVILIAVLAGEAVTGAWVVLAVGLGYGGAAAWLGTMVGGAMLDRRAPEVLIAITPRR